MEGLEIFCSPPFAIDLAFHRYIRILHPWQSSFFYGYSFYKCVLISMLRNLKNFVLLIWTVHGWRNITHKDVIAAAMWVVLLAYSLTTSILLCFFKRQSDIQMISPFDGFLLISHEYRIEGLLLLEKIISQSNTEVFTKHVRSWMNLLLQVLQVSTLY